MAQYYHIYDWRKFPVQYIAILACGLPNESRTMMALQEQPIDYNTWFLGTIVDELNILIYQHSQGKADKPTSVVETLLSYKKGQESSAPTFDSAEEFLLYRKKYVKDE